MTISVFYTDMSLDVQKKKNSGIFRRRSAVHVGYGTALGPGKSWILNFLDIST